MRMTSSFARRLASACQAIIVALRFLLPLLYLRFPFRSGWANFLLDGVDGDVLMSLGMSRRRYQRMDKSADWLAYVGMVIAGWCWPIRRSLALLFAIRSIGQGAYLKTGNDRWLAVFPNLLEPLFLTYATIRAVRGEGASQLYRRWRRLIWTGVILYKAQDEWITLLAAIDRTDMLKGRLLDGR